MVFVAQVMCVDWFSKQSAVDLPVSNGWNLRTELPWIAVSAFGPSLFMRYLTMGHITWCVISELPILDSDRSNAFLWAIHLIDSLSCFMLHHNSRASAGHCSRHNIKSVGLPPGKSCFLQSAKGDPGLYSIPCECDHIYIGQSEHRPNNMNWKGGICWASYGILSPGPLKTITWQQIRVLHGATQIRAHCSNQGTIHICFHLALTILNLDILASCPDLHSLTTCLQLSFSSVGFLSAQHTLTLFSSIFPWQAKPPLFGFIINAYYSLLLVHSVVVW